MPDGYTANMPPASIRPRAFLVPILAVLLLAGPSLPRLPREARRETRYAVRLATRGSWREAEVHLRRALVLAPGHPGLLHDLGVVARALGRDIEARRFLARARAAGFVPDRRCREVRVPRPRPAIVPWPPGRRVTVAACGDHAEEVSRWLARVLARDAGLAPEAVPCGREAVLVARASITATDRSGYEEEDARDDPYLLEPTARPRFVVRRLLHLELRVEVRDEDGRILHRDTWSSEAIDRGLRDERDLVYDLLAPLRERLVGIFRPGRRDEPACLWAG